MFAALAASPVHQIIGHTLFMIVTISIVAGGIHRGIERSNKVMMPALFLLLCALLVYSLQTERAMAGVDFLLHPRWGQPGS